MQRLTMSTKPKTPIVRPRYDFLQSEVARWQEDNILNRAQGEEILARYDVEGGSQHGLLALVITGVCILGASLMLFISSNSQDIAAPVKGLVVICSMLAFYISAWQLKGKSPFQAVLSEAFVFLGSVSFGGATVIVSQHFQITGNQPELLLWAIAIAPVVIVFRSLTTAILCASIACYAAFGPGTDAYQIDCFPFLCTFSAVFCAYYMRSQVALFIAACGFAGSICRSSLDVAYFALLFFGIACFILHLWHEHSRRWQIMSTPYLLVSGICVLAPICCMIGYFSGCEPSTANSMIKIQWAAISTLAMLACLVKSPAIKTKWPWVVGLLIVAAVIFSTTITHGSNKVSPLCAFCVANLFFLFYITSSIENRLIQFLPVAIFTIFSISFIAIAPGGAMLSSGVTFGVGLVLMICSFAALRKSMRAESERSLN